MTAEAIRLGAGSDPSLRDSVARLRNRVAGRLQLGLRSTFTRYGLCRNLAAPLTTPSAKIPISVRPLQERDFAALFGAGKDQDPGDRMEAALRLAFIAKGARRGFVAADTRTDTACYVQWLFGAQDNDFIRRLKGFPPLEEGQALLENAYTPPAYRGLGIMSAAMALIAERATEIGARQVFTFVGVDNIASLKGCQRAGFHPVLLHDCVRLGFGLIRRDRFETLPDADPRRTVKF